uniref:Cl25046_1a n=1 Tax=Arundo donax TaxID=35708 RepID=A0A0A9F6P3_ARUDO
MDEGVVEGGEDARDAENVLALADGGAQRHVLLLGLPRLLPPGHGCDCVLAAEAAAAGRKRKKARVRRWSGKRATRLARP